MSDRIWKFFTSLRLTVVLLIFGIILVFVGTVAQADEGLYIAQTRYFKHWYVWGISMFGHRVPVLLPGGYLIGTLLLVNLVAAHIRRFQMSAKKIGIHLTHAGIILLLVGQLTTDIFSHETQMHFAEGETRNYSESAMDYELAFLSDAADGNDDVVAIPQALLKDGGELSDPHLPFTVKVKNFWPNSEPNFRAPMRDNKPPVTTNGVATSFDFKPDSEQKSMDSKNVPTAVIELVGKSGSLGTWVASGWSADEQMVNALGGAYQRQMGAQLAGVMIGKITQPQAVEADGHKYAFFLRPARVYSPYSLTLLKASNTTYQGSDIPRDFRSRVRIDNPQTKESREVEIYMNTPLRYNGLTYYQYQMSAGEMAQRAGLTPSSTLQIVRNPAWLTPYAGCLMVGLGLVVQFMIHLVGFVSRRKTA